MKMRKLVVRMILIAVFGFMISLNSAMQAASATDFHACALLTSQEIHEIAEITVGSGTEDMMEDLYQCSWAAEEENAVSPMISYEKAGANTKAGCNQRWEGEKKLAKRMEDLSGLGEKAWWSFKSKASNSNIGAVTICGPAGILRVSLWGPGQEPKMKTITEALARKAYGRLQQK